MVKFDLLHGDALEVLKKLPDESIQCCITSPPYFRLRNYGVDGQIGLEDTPEEYVDKLVNVFREVRRVLHTTGVVYLNLGDTYSSSGGNGQSRHFDGRKKNFSTQFIRTKSLPIKNLLMIPARVAIALQENGWILRDEIIWQKQNALPSSVRDRTTRSHEIIYMLTKSSKYYYDYYAVLEPAKSLGKPRNFRKKETLRNDIGNVYIPISDGKRNLRSVWDIPTKPFKGSHFSVYPESLVEIPVKASISEKGACTNCGAQWTRIIKRTTILERNDNGRTHSLESQRFGKTPVPEKGWQSIRESIGWKQNCKCGTNEVRPPVVLDPFCGAGTTGVVALKHGCDFIGIDLNKEYLDTIARPRLEKTLNNIAEKQKQKKLEI